MVGEETPVKIALDLEGVLADSNLTWREAFERKYRIEYPENLHYQWNQIEEAKHGLGIAMTSEAHAELWVEAWRDPLKVPVYDSFARYIVPWLRVRGHEVEVLTSSFPGSEGKKDEWVRHFLGDVKVVHVEGGGQEKAELGYDCFIDDRPHTAVQVTRAGKKMILYTRTWNLGVQPPWYSIRIRALDDLISGQCSWI